MRRAGHLQVSHPNLFVGTERSKGLLDKCSGAWSESQRYGVFSNCQFLPLHFFYHESDSRILFLILRPYNHPEGLRNKDQPNQCATMQIGKIQGKEKNINTLQSQVANLKGVGQIY